MNTEKDKEIEEINFAKDTRIHFRCTPYWKRKIQARARALGLSVSRYLRRLVEEDLRN